MRDKRYWFCHFGINVGIITAMNVAGIAWLTNYLLAGMVYGWHWDDIYRKYLNGR